MERDLDLYRDILFMVESAGTPYDHRGIVFNKDSGVNVIEEELENIPDSIQESDPDVLTRHVELMVQAGLLEGNSVDEGLGPAPSISVFGITHEGYEFLDAVRSSDIWAQAQDALTQKSVGTTLAPSSPLYCVKRSACQAG
jgi:hypothetical protein